MRACMLVLSAIVLAGCAVDRDGLMPPPRPSADAGMTDAPAAPDVQEEQDAPDDVPDVHVPDAPVDAEPADADSGMDAGMDASPPDAGAPDAGPMDAGPSDAGAPDTRPPPVGCMDDTIEQAYPSPDMVGCDGAQSQCTAAALCAPGWHLCGYGEYRGRGGDTSAASSLRWIASCVRSGCGPADGPTVAICGSCSTGTGSSIELSYQCGGSEAPRNESACNVGVAAGSSGWHLVSRFLECIMAGAEPAHTLAGATCCR